MRKLRLILLVVLALVAVGSGILAGMLIVHASRLPQVSTLEEYKPSATTRIFADGGELLAEFYMEDRIPVSLAQVPQHVRKAFLAAEDPRFYRHSGIDISGIFRALYKNAVAGKVVQGGSSITQQLAKMLFLEPEKTMSRKVKEALLALQIERHYSKDEILALYLNQVYLGGGAYGVEAAARRYFGKDVWQLSLAEGAMLAGLPAAPNKYSPANDPERASQRRRHVLRRMCDEGFITRDEMAAADREPLAVKRTRIENVKAPYFVEYVRRKVEERYGSSTLYRGGLNIYTTLNLRMQEIAEGSLGKGLDALAKRHPRKDAEVQGAFLAIEPGTGYIKAMIGGRDFAKSEFNRSTQALRQPGSAFKPIIFTAALDGGYRPDDVLEDSPVSYPGSRPGERWQPTNFDNKFEGPVTLRHALARSINVIAVKLLDKVGIQAAIDCAKKLGITAELAPYLPLALGASDTTLIEMTSAYAVFDNLGVYAQPAAIERITDREGGILEDYVPVTSQVLSPETASAMTDMLEGVVQYGTGWEARTLGRPAAGKTGTTSNYNDAWFIGYIPGMVAGVWTGYDDHKTIGNKETGARAALPVWLGFMKGYTTEFKIPPEDFPVPPHAFENQSGVVQPPPQPEEEAAPEEAPHE